MANHELLPVLGAASWCCGASLALARRLEPLLGERLGDRPTQVRILLAAFLLGLVFGLPLGGLAVDEWGPAWGLALAPLGMSLAVGLLAVEPSFAAALATKARPAERFGAHLAALAGLGVSTAWLSCASIVLMPAALWPEQPGAAVNIGFVFIGLGALSAPLLTEPMRRSDRVARTLGILAAIFLAPGFVALATPTNWPTGHDADLDPVLTDPVVGLAAAALILFGMIAGGMERWIEQRADNWRPYALYWAPFLAAQLLVVPLLAGAGLASGFEPWTAVGVGLFLLVVLGQLAGLPDADRVPRVVGAVGFALGPLAPTLAAALLLRFPQASGVALGVALAGGFLGQEALQPLARWLGDRLPGRRSGVPLGTGLVLLLVLLAFALLQVKEERHRTRPPLPFRLPTIHLPKMPHFHLVPALDKKATPAERPSDSASEGRP